MPARLPSLLADPPPAGERLWLENARLFDGTGAAVRERASVLVEGGRIARLAEGGGAPPEGARAVDLAGRTLLPGLIDAHAHVGGSFPKPTTAAGAEPLLPGTLAHHLAAELREVLRMGITTMRDVGSVGDLVVEARQAMRYGAFHGPRLLTCGRIVSPTGPGARFFAGMYREADGPDDVRRAVREQLRYGADFVKHNVEQAQLTLVAARTAGVRLAVGHDTAPLHAGMNELLRMIEAGLTPREALVAATSGGAYALGLTEHVGTVEPGKLADLIAVDGDPLAEPELICDRARIWLVLRLGAPVAGTALETDLGCFNPSRSTHPGGGMAGADE